jgi:hypothetical protein
VRDLDDAGALVFDLPHRDWKEAKVLLEELS